MTHVEDGELLRWIDRDFGPGQRAAVRRHVASCGTCRARLTEIERWSALLHRAVGTVAHPRRPSRWRRRLAAAAGIAIAVGLAAPPVRAWMFQRVAAVWSVFAAEPGDAAGGRAPTAGPDAPPGTSVTFAPEGPVFRVYVTSFQAVGALTLATVDADVVSAAVLGGDGGEELLVLPSGVRIRNLPASSADYAIRVPVGVREIVLQIGDAAQRRFGTDPAGQIRRIPLRAPR